MLGVLAWSWAAPLALAMSTDTTPACCHRDGKHHCISGMSSMMLPGEKDPAFLAFPSCCPFRSTIATPSSVAQLGVARTSTHVAPSSIPALESESSAVSSTAHSRFSQRGPPTQLP